MREIEISFVFRPFVASSKTNRLPPDLSHLNALLMWRDTNKQHHVHSSNVDLFQNGLNYSPIQGRTG